MKAITKLIKNTTEKDLKNFESYKFIEIYFNGEKISEKYDKMWLFEASKKHFFREINKVKENHNRLFFYKKWINLFEKLTFDLTATSSRYNMTGIDWVAFTRPSSNGMGWVGIAPDEPANNVYVDCPFVVKHMKRYFGIN